MTRSISPFVFLIVGSILVTVLDAETRGAGPRYRIAYATYLGGGQFDQLREVIVYPDGSELLYATYLGGSGADLVRSVALGPRGELYLLGSTTSSDFPVTPNAAQPTLGGKTDAFVVKLVPAR